MPRVRDLVAWLDSFAPPVLGESWDNLGLLLGDRDAEASKALTCLTLTPDVADEAVRGGAGLVVAHHPILFRAIKRLTSDTAEGAMLLALAFAGVAVYSPHTAFDGTVGGINDQIAGRLGLTDVSPIRAPTGRPELSAGLGAGRYGTLAEPCDFAAFARRVRTAFGLSILQAVPVDRPVRRVAVACGSAADFLPDALAAGCDVFVTGEARFHAALEARTQGIGLVLLGHYASERFAVESLAERLGREFPGLTAWASRSERDPLAWL